MIPEAAVHTREVIAVHVGIGEEAICSQCYVYWPCKAIAEQTATTGDPLPEGVIVTPSGKLVVEW